MGESVKKIADIIAKTMMPAVLTAHKVDQKHLNEAQNKSELKPV